MGSEAQASSTTRGANVSSFQTLWSENGLTRCPKEQADSCWWVVSPDWALAPGRQPGQRMTPTKWRHIGLKGVVEQW